MKNKFKNWLRKLFPKREATYDHLIVEELPIKMKPHTIYICEHKGYHWQLSLLCPCGCKEILYVNLIEDYEPCWKYQLDSNNLLTVYPSFYRKEQCGSHFFIKNGKIEWMNR